MAATVQIVSILSPDQVRTLEEQLKAAIGRGEWLTRIQYRYTPHYEKVARMLKNDKGVMALALEGTAIVGSMYASYPTADRKNLTQFHKLLVLPAYRGRGIALRLFESLEEAVRKRGKTGIWFRYHRDNPAKALYTRLGYKEVHRPHPLRIWIRVEKPKT